MSVKIHFTSSNTFSSTRQITSNEVNLQVTSLNKKISTLKMRLVRIKYLQHLSRQEKMPLKITINDSRNSSKFPGMAKVATVIAIDKKMDIRFDISNDGLANLLSYFLKVYENSIKYRLVDSMHNNISPFILAYSKNGNTQYVLLCRYLEEWRENLDKNYVVERVLMDQYKAF